MNLQNRKIMLGVIASCHFNYKRTKFHFLISFSPPIHVDDKGLDNLDVDYGSLKFKRGSSIHLHVLTTNFKVLDV